MKKEGIEKHIEYFFSISEVIPDSNCAYDIYVYVTESWKGIYQLDGDEHLFKTKVSSFNPNWKVFDDSEIVDEVTLWTPVYGDHSVCEEKDFNKYRKAHLSYYKNVSMWKFKSKNLIEKAAEFYTDTHNDFRKQFGEFGIQEWFFDKYVYPNHPNINGNEELFSHLLDKGTDTSYIIKPVFLSRMNECLSWHTHAKQDVNYFNEAILIRYKKINK